MSRKKHHKNAVRERPHLGQLERPTRLFNGYVRDPIPAVFFVCLVGFAALALTGWAIFERLTYQGPSEFEEATVTVLQMETDDLSYLLNTSEGEFDILIGAVTGLEGFEKAVSSGGSFHILWAAGDDDLWGITDENGTSFAAYSSVYQAKQQYLNQIVLATGAVALAFWAFWIWAYHIISNAPKHPILVRLLVRKCALNI